MRTTTKKKQIRQTTQRQIILEELSNLTSHPTATELYHIVRQRLPRIGLGTIYRNLESMAQNGVICKLDVGGAGKRFDPITTPHYHVRCIFCDCVEDIEIEPHPELEKKAQIITDFAITGHTVEYQGICAACQQQQQNRQRKTA